MGTTLKVYTDGGSRGNPGNAGIGVYITDIQGKEIEKRYKNIGKKTNNEAEYTAAYLGIQRAIELGAKSIHLYTDSELIVKQLKGEYKIKKTELQELRKEIVVLVANHQIDITYTWIPREQNTQADRLSNVAMDQK